MDGEPKKISTEDLKSTSVQLRNRIRESHSVPEDFPGEGNNKGREFSTRSREEALWQIDLFLTSLPMKTATSLRRGVRFLHESQNRAAYSLLDFARKQESGEQHAGEAFRFRRAGELFHPITGSIVMHHERSLKSPYDAFYTDDRVVASQGILELRGKEYAIPLTSTRRVEEKVHVIEQVMHDGINLVSSTDRQSIKTPEEYLLYLGVLDYLKMHSQILYHAVTYDEREGIIPAGDEKYLDQKRQTHDMMRLFTRMYYQSLLGTPFDREVENIQELHEKVDAASSFTLKKVKNSKKGRAAFRFKYPEANHPLTIALGAYEAVRSNPDTNIILGIPTGGTETAIVTQMMYELYHNRSPDMIFVPISFNSEIHRFEGNRKKWGLGDSKILDLVNFNYPSDKMKDSNVLLIDDNSSSGQTLEAIARILRVRMVESVKSVKVHLVEFDSRSFRGKRSNKYSFFDVSQSPSTRGIGKTSAGGQPLHRKYFENIGKS